MKTTRRRHGMTTHDEQTNITTSAPADQPSSASVNADPAPAQSGPMAGVDEPSRPSAEPEAASPTAVTEESTNGSLFADDDRTSLHSRWNDVQAGFVDDPKECVQRADALVAD